MAYEPVRLREEEGGLSTVLSPPLRASAPLSVSDLGIAEPLDELVSDNIARGSDDLVDHSTPLHDRTITPL